MVLKNTIAQGPRGVKRRISLLDAGIGEKEVPCDEVDDLFELPALIKDVGSGDQDIVDDEDDEDNEDDEDDEDDEVRLPPRKRIRPAKYCD
jgi:hypothetical protein